MAEAVTYADLRFAQSPPQGKRRPPPAHHAHQEGSDVEITYENCPAAAAAPRPRRPCNPTPASPEAPPQAPGHVWRRIWSRVPLALLGACLFLLAAALGLGLRYRQVSRQLEEASQRHTAESGILAERIGSQEENLTRYLQQLAQAQAELSATQQALWQSWQAGNRTQRQLEEELQQAQSRLISSWQEKDKASQELEKARSCQQRGCCPPGWALFRWKCLWVSGEWKTWEESRQACEKQGAQLLVLKPWDASTTWDATEITGHLQSEEFWVGLIGWSVQNGRTWLWLDYSRYERTDTPPLPPGYNNYVACTTLKQRRLSGGACTRTHRYVCEKAASPGGPGGPA